MIQSRRNVRSTRGENWLLVSWSTTMVIENTRPVNEIIDVMIAESSARAPSGPPVKRKGTFSEVSSHSSSAVRESPRRAARAAHRSGTAQNSSRRRLKVRVIVALLVLAPQQRGPGFRRSLARQRRAGELVHSLPPALEKRTTVG